MLPVKRLSLFSIWLVAVALSGCGEPQEPLAGTDKHPLEADNREFMAPFDDAITAVEQDNRGNSAPQVTALTRAADSSAHAAIYQGVPLQVADISEGDYDDGQAIVVTFSVPVDGSRDIQSYFSVEKKIAANSWQTSGGAWVLADDGLTAFFDQVEPGTTYRATVSPGLAAINGETLHKPSSASISFGDLNASASFASNGHFLPLNLHTGLPVYALNTPEVNVTFLRVKNDELAGFIQWKNSGLSERYYRLEALEKFSDPVFDGRFTLTSEANKRRLINLPVQNIKALREPGVYIAVMARPAAFDSQLAFTYFTVTDIGMQVRAYANHFDVYLNTLADPAPVAGAAVSLINGNGSVAFEGNSNDQGWLQVRRNKKWGQVLVARKGDSISFVSLDTPAVDLSDFNLGERPQQARELFIYSPRDIYRGGETAVFSALLRDHDGQMVKTPPLKARIVRPDGQKIKEVSLRSRNDGYYQYEYALASDAPTGDWRFEVEGISGQRVVYRFKVEDFMPERLKLTFNPDNRQPLFFSTQQNIRIPLLGEYLYGAPAAGNRFDASIRVAPLAHPFEVYTDYYFGNDSDSSNNQQFEQNGALLDDEGRYQLDFASRWNDARTPLAVSVTGSLFESGGRPLVRRYTARVLPAEALIGIRPAFKKFAAANSLAEFELLKTNQAGELSAVTNARVRLINLNRRYHWRYDSSRGWYVDSTEREFTALTLTRSIAADGSSKVTVPVKYGTYRLEVEDPQTGLISSLTFNAGENWYWSWEGSADSEQGARPDKVTLALDKASYDAGDVAQLKIVPPAGGESLVLVESDELLWSQRVSLPAEGATVSIPVDKAWKRHDLYISVVHLQPADNKERITPTRSLGLIALPLNREPRRLSVTLDAPEKWLPDQNVVTTVQINDATGQPVDHAWVTLAAVDTGILSLTDFKTPDAFDWFFHQRRYAVDIRDMYSRLIDLNDNRLATLKYGGDADALSRGGKKARADVQIVSLFSGLVEVKNGSARIPLSLPDFNGRLRLMAVAFDGHRFGHIEQEVTLAAPVVTQLSMPRFVAVGDETIVALDVTNLSGRQQQLALDFQVSGPATIPDPAAQQATLSLADGQKKTVILPLRAEYPAGQIALAMTLSDNHEYRLQRRWTLNSRAANPAQTQQKDVMLKPGESLQLSSDELTGLVAPSLEALLSVNTMVNLNPRGQLEYLLRYPYGCLEQSISASWPWIYASDDQLQRMGLNNNTGHLRSQALESGMERVIKRQMSHGGFGLWSRQDEFEQNWLTAYAADFLIDARDEGVRVDQETLTKALNRLSEYVRGRATFQERWSGRPELYRQSYQAYAAYVLARVKKAPLAEIRRLANELLADSPALPVLHLALAAYLQGDQALAEQLLNKLKQTQRLRNVYLGDYGSEVRDRAQVVRLLLHYDLDEPYALEQARQLQTTLRRRQYLSTQERNSVFMAAIELQGMADAPWQGELRVSGDAQSLNGRGLFSRLLRGESLSGGLTFSNRGDNNLYVSLAYQGNSQLPPPVVSQGLLIERRYFSTDGQLIQPDDGALRMTVGELMLVQVRVKPLDEHRRPDLMLIDLLPAGLELENQNLKASVKLDELVIEGQSLRHWSEQSRIHHQEYRDDRFVAAFDSAYYDATSIFYLVRAVTPGNYQVPAALVEDMYDPEIRAVGATPDILTISQP